MENSGIGHYVGSHVFDGCIMYRANLQFAGYCGCIVFFGINLQSKGMKLVADRTDSAASVSTMDLSVEAEALVNCYAEPEMVHAVMEKATLETQSA